MNKMIIVIGLLLLLLVAAGGGYYYQTQSSLVEAHKEIEEPASEAYLAFVLVNDIYYSSNNGKRTKLIAMDIAIEAKDELSETEFKKNIPRIKGEILKILATPKYKNIDDASLLTFINENFNSDVNPILKKISSAGAYSQVHVTKLIIQ
ncbi:flagellar protein FliL [Psychromonas ingrahamii 37]|uniref:Flagellar protein FliL n=1 Tax=Psychromonas ingrahamii (strain DSM 17664 / CCUG 51855 / 37) TaxID=357804 RepID=A1T0K0_PSYIN|nr:flagellar basal body-associated FliL family protein [Psychromonas ingrahamii]ABM05265.1 flagellar protein FliL [Psychromonas ingrahamii 37]